MPYPITTQKALRAAFWDAHPSFDHQARAAGIRSKSQNHHCATVRLTWCDFVDMMARDGQISESLAQRATL